MKQATEEQMNAVEQAMAEDYGADKITVEPDRKIRVPETGRLIISGSKTRVIITMESSDKFYVFNIADARIVATQIRQMANIVEKEQQRAERMKAPERESKGRKRH